MKVRQGTVWAVIDPKDGMVWADGNRLEVFDSREAARQHAKVNIGEGYDSVVRKITILDYDETRTAAEKEKQ